MKIQINQIAVIIEKVSNHRDQTFKYKKESNSHLWESRYISFSYCEKTDSLFVEEKYNNKSILLSNTISFCDELNTETLTTELTEINLLY